MLSIKKISFLALAIVLCTPFLAIGQSEKKTDSDSIKTVAEAIRDSAFVLKANSIRGRYSYNHFVSPNTNFIKVDGDEIVIQTANPHRIGYNGLGGVTITGNIRGYEINKDEDGVRVFIEMSSAVLGLTTINLSANNYGNATANIRSSFGRYASFEGKLYPIEGSLNYEGDAVL